MYKKYFTIISGVFAALLLSSCVSDTGKQDQARLALQGFFANLAGGKYESAVDQYAGSYETLIFFNPDQDPDDYTTLWQNGCQFNGLQCLTVHSVTFSHVNEAGEYIFSVEFNTWGGGLFELGACCGEEQTTQPQSRFEFRVVESDDGQFRVLDLPVFVP
jgi:hypothetical protein